MANIKGTDKLDILIAISSVIKEAGWDAMAQQFIDTLVSPSGNRHQLGKGQESAVNFADGIIRKSA